MQMTHRANLRPALLPVVGGTHVTKDHQVLALMAESSHATHQRARPRTAIDAVNGTAALPLWWLWQLQLVKVQVGVALGPAFDVPCLRWLRSHSSSAFVANAPNR